MSSEHTLSLTPTRSSGRRSDGDPISVPVADLVASNGLVTGQSGATPTETTVDLVETALDGGETVLVVDPTGAFESLATDPAVLHVGSDRQCDVQVDPDAADRVASLAVGGDTSVLLDLESVDAADSDALLGSLSDALLDSGSGRSKDLLLVLDQCHRWLAADGPSSRAAENLVQLGGRRHDVGILGVTDQPGDLRGDVTGGIDWLLAHRLTWREDVAAVADLLEGTRAEDLESLDDGEALFSAGWERGVHWVSVEDTDPGAVAETETPETASATDDTADDGVAAGDDLLAGLAEVRNPSADGDDPTSDAAEERSNHDLSALAERVDAIEEELDDRDDVLALGERIADAIVEGLSESDVIVSGAVETSEIDDETADTTESTTSATDATTTHSEETDPADEANDAGGFGDVFDAFGNGDGETNNGSDTAANGSGAPTGGSDTADIDPSPRDAERAAADTDATAADADSGLGAGSTGGSSADDGGMSFEPIDFGFDEEQDAASADFGPPARHGTSGRSIPRYLRKIVRGIEEMDAKTRRMLAHYVEEGRASPMDAHYAAGGGGDRTRAYAFNRQLRTNGFIEHVGKGNYGPRLREYVVDRAGHSVPEHELDRAVEVIRQTIEDV